jgi:hypothetical protein
LVGQTLLSAGAPTAPSRASSTTSVSRGMSAAPTSPSGRDTLAPLDTLGNGVQTSGQPSGSLDSPLQDPLASDLMADRVRPGKKS